MDYSDRTSSSSRVHSGGSQRRITQIAKTYVPVTPDQCTSSCGLLRPQHQFLIYSSQVAGTHDRVLPAAQVTHTAQVDPELNAIILRSEL